MAVQSVSLDEIKKARGASAQPSQQKSVKTARADSTNQYINKMTDKQIREFFAPYGYFDHVRNEKAGTIEVLCFDCMIIFNDFTLLAGERNWYDADGEHQFNFHEFSMLCAQIGTTPSRAIADRLEKEVLSKMPYYVERKKAFTENNIDGAANDSQYGYLLQATAEKEKLREGYASLNKTYGSTDPVKIADTLATLSPNK